MKKYIVITGGTSGIGKSIAVRFSKLSGYQVIVFTSKDDLKAIAEPVDNVIYITACDLSEISKYQLVITSFVESLKIGGINNGLVECFVHCAVDDGLYGLDRAMQVNVHSAEFIIKQFSTAMLFAPSAKVMLFDSDFTSPEKRSLANSKYDNYGVSKLELVRVFHSLIRTYPAIRFLLLNPSLTYTSLFQSINKGILSFKLQKDPESSEIVSKVEARQSEEGVSSPDDIARAVEGLLLLEKFEMLWGQQIHYRDIRLHFMPDTKKGCVSVEFRPAYEAMLKATSVRERECPETISQGTTCSLVL